jgi:tetratricopeptide (TPR) repeat protein
MDARSSRKALNARRALVAAALCAVLALVYWRAPRMQFLHLDDYTAIVDNPRLNPPSLAGIPFFWRSAHMNLYVPMPYTAWELVALSAGHPVQGSARWEFPPGAFHLVNVALHAACAWLAFMLMRRLVASDAAALAGTALFALHPLQVEAVAWSMGLRDLLCAAFSLLALLGYLRFAARDQRTRARGAWEYTWASIAYLSALASKPSAVVVPLFALLVGLAAFERVDRRRLSALLPWAAIAIAWTVLTHAVQALTSVHPLAAWTRPLVAGDALAFYLWKLAVPLELCVDYGRTPERVVGHTWGWLTWLAPAALAALVIWKRKDWPRVAIVAGLFAAGVLPVLGFVPFAFQWMSTVGDRYAYMSMLGPALGVAWWLAEHPTRIAWSLAAAVLALLAFASERQTRFWVDDRACFEHTLAVNPESFVSQGYLGVIYAGEGRTREAVEAYERALQGNPNDLRTRINLAYALATVGRTDDAIRELERALSTGLQDPQAERYLDVLRARRREADATRAK